MTIPRARCLLFRCVPLLLAAAALFLAPRAPAATANDIAPANVSGSRFTLRYSGNRTFETNLSLTNNIFTIQFTSATTYVRSGSGTPGIVTEGGTYAVTASTEAAGIRTTVITFNNNFTRPGDTVPVVITFLSSPGEPFASTFALTSGTATAAGTYGVERTSVAPVIGSSTVATATVGLPFTYQIVATNTPTSYSATANSQTPIPGLTVGSATGLVSATFAAPGLYLFNVFATNAAGTDNRQVGVTVTAAAGTGVPAITNTPTVLAATVGSPFTYALAATPAATAFENMGGDAPVAINPVSGVVTGTFTRTGTFTFSVRARNASGTGATVVFTVTATGGTVVPTAAAAPVNFVGYRNRVGSVFELRVTGAASGAVWGTDVYTDDSSVARAAVHAGVLAVGETKTVTVTILPGQSSYAASARNGVSSASWGGWYGSYAFAGAGAVTAGTAVAATARPALAPGFTAATVALATGGRFVCPINVTGGGTYTYQWFLNGVRLAGATANPYVVDVLTAADAGTYTVDVTNALGTARLTAGTVTVGAAGSPVLTLQPIAKNVVPGGTFTVAASATGSGLSYQWFRNGTALAGETGAILLRNNAGTTDAGNYSVRVANSSGTVTSSAAAITLSADASRPANISVRTAVATGATVIPGFFIQGTGTKRVLIRAVGPGLGAFGLTGTMGDPTFAVFQGSTRIAANDDWSAANIASAFSATGAFALPAGSKDAALVTDLAAGRDYTVQVTNASGTGGIVLIEVYDADALVGRSTSKLVNVSVRGRTAPGDDVLTLGLVIGGNGPRTLLVRGIGPTLAAFGVTGTVADPAVQIFDGQARAILANDDWSQADFVGELALATGYVGAFALGAGSKDAATLALVQPGAYTIQVAGTAAAPTGEALVEVYEVP